MKPKVGFPFWQNAMILGWVWQRQPMELHTHTRLRVVILGTLISSYLLLCDCVSIKQAFNSSFRKSNEKAIMNRLYVFLCIQFKYSDVCVKMKGNQCMK